jgi:hypothetical protein
MFEAIEKLVPEKLQRSFRQWANDTEADDRLTQRKSWAAEIQRAEDEHRKVSPALWAEENKLREALEREQREAEARIKKAKAVYWEAQRARQKADEQRDAIVGPASASLRASASEKIYEFAKRLEQRRHESSFPEREWARDPVTGREVVVKSTLASLQIAVKRINEILRDDLRVVELEPLSDEELDERLNALEGSIPEIVMEKL